MVKELTFNLNGLVLLSCHLQFKICYGLHEENVIEIELDNQGSRIAVEFPFWSQLLKSISDGSDSQS